MATTKGKTPAKKQVKAAAKKAIAPIKKAAAKKVAAKAKKAAPIKKVAPKKATANKTASKKKAAAKNFSKPKAPIAKKASPKKVAKKPAPIQKGRSANAINKAPIKKAAPSPVAQQAIKKEAPKKQYQAPVTSSHVHHGLNMHYIPAKQEQHFMQSHDKVEAEKAFEHNEEIALHQEQQKVKNNLATRQKRIFTTPRQS